MADYRGFLMAEKEHEARLAAVRTECVAIAAENAALKAQLAYAVSTGDECAIEVETLRKDAERYRHVWDNWPLTFGEMLQNGYGVYPIENKAQGDAAIDAAMEQSQ